MKKNLLFILQQFINFVQVDLNKISGKEVSGEFQSVPYHFLRKLCSCLLLLGDTSCHQLPIVLKEATDKYK